MSGIVFQDNFENNNLDKWTIVQAQWSTTDAQQKFGTYSAYGAGKATDRTLVKTLPYALAKSRLTFYVRVNETTGTHYLSHWPSYALMIAAGYFKYSDGTVKHLPVTTPCSANTWYKVEIECIAATNSIKYWIEDAYKGEVTTIAFANIDEIRALTSSVVGRNMFFDEVMMEDLEALSGSVEAQSSLTGNIKTVEKLAGLIEGQSALASANLQWLQELAGSISAQSSAGGSINVIGSLGGLITAQSSLTGTIFSAEVLAGLITAQSALTGFLEEIGEGVLSGSIAAQSGVSGNLQFCYGSIPPAMHSVLIDPYSGGAWLWFVEIRIPGYSLIRLARNTEDIIYGGITYLADNFTIGLAPLAGEGSVPRTLLKIAQDADYTLEDKLNATKGGYGGRITIIRAHEDFLTIPIVELEDTVDILTSESDTEHIIIPCGIPNPLIRKIPLWRGSSKICSWALPGLFKGVDCQYAGGDGTCTGKYEDCYAKGNAVHWGGELGLDPTVTRV